MYPHLPWMDGWLKEPLLLSIDTHRNLILQQKKLVSDPFLEQMDQHWVELKKQITSSVIDPMFSHHYLQQITHLHREYQQWAKQPRNPSITTATTGEEESEITAQRVPIGQHRLPPLPYAYDAFEPHIDQETMRLHHDKHHRSYVDNLNKAERELQQARKKGDFSLINHWENELAFHGAGHYLHTIFWSIMNPKGGGKPKGALYRQIQLDFGTLDSFQQQFSAAAEKVQGSGWAIWVWSPRSHRTEILQAEKHQNGTQWDVIPLLVLDVWEHAYYLRYQNRRKDYIRHWWNLVYWKEVERRFRIAQRVKWNPY